MNIKTMCWRSSIAVVMVFMGLLLAVPPASANGSGPSIVPISGTAAGKTYGQWSAEWWNRAFTLTTATAGDCRQINRPEPQQSNGPVWFLYGSTGGQSTRTCTVPAGKFIMFPIFNIEWSKVEALAAASPAGTCVLPGVVPSGTEYAGLLACAKAQADHALRPDAVLEADVDHISVRNLPGGGAETNFRAASPFPPFSFTPPSAGDVFGVCTSPVAMSCPESDRQAVADGYWIILNPLSLGQHTVHFKAEVHFPEINFTLALEVTYTLTIQKSQ